MVSIEKIQRGAARYIDTELLPKVDGRDKWVLSAAVTLAIAKLPAAIQSLNSKEAVKALGLISADGMSIDLDALIASVKPAARQAPAVFNIPFGGSIAFTEADIDALYKIIMST